MAIPTGLTNADTAKPTGSAESPEGNEDVTAAAYLFRTLGDPTRLLILRHLARGEHRVVDLMSHLGLAQSTVSGHLACLRDCGLVRSRAQGRASLYSLARPELLDLFHATESFLEATGERVVLHHTVTLDHEHRAHGHDDEVPVPNGPARSAGRDVDVRHPEPHHAPHPGLELGHEAAEHPA
ncbi:DNA-binding transcriptional ArsR family regulator [Kineosporia succinea]|uniref:DNA-binding transcriptional ArsR family regulator n=1 Tax=Kineosporia succinea TaxID=84632 RepID=A0ABT9P6Y1_9ACTN|nr:metalloregulator ArsR/SmtB family transcription factor [Kineosporia succinea]MDP9828197.1 DNA-binding transcriptional ArsR family regulator [Kineosporia succinea]